VFEYIPEDIQFLYRAAVAWDPGLMDIARLATDLDSSSASALHTSKPVILMTLSTTSGFGRLNSPGPIAYDAPSTS
jgi:hypothetical protein